jgi:multidrug efflux pump subunit AcrA (membrane-fusion protein)
MEKQIILVLILMLGACRSNIDVDVQTAEVNRGEFYIEVTEEGEIQATSAINISSPSISWQFGMLKITYIVEDGTEVSAGDTVLQFDPTDVQKVIIDAQADLEIANAEMAKLVAQQESRINELEADLKISELDYQINQIRLEQATFDSEVARKELQLSLDKAKISLETARNEIENQKLIHAEEIRQKNVSILQLKKNLQDAFETMEKLTVTSPASGVAILQENWSTDEKWAVGEQPWSGEPLINLPDMSELEAETEINEVDIAKIKLGQRVEIKLDAFSDTVYTGQVSSIAGLAKFKNRDSRVKVFPVEILLDEAPRKFMPGMTVSCKILVNKIDDALYIPLESVYASGNEDYVFIKSTGGFRKKTIETGLANNDFTIVKEGLKEGDVVSLIDLSAEDEE